MKKIKSEFILHRKEEEEKEEAADKEEKVEESVSCEC